MSEAILTEDGTTETSVAAKPLILKLLVGCLALFLAAELAFFLVVVPMTSRVRLNIQGAPSIGYDELCSLAGISGTERWFSFDTAAVASRLMANPLFEAVSVEKSFPDRVLVTVTERVAVAVTFGTINGRTVPMEIDRTGVAFRIGQGCAQSNLPVLTGLTFENPVAGMRLNAQLKPLLEQVKALSDTNPALLSLVSEIKIEQKTFGGYDLVIYPVHTPVRVRTDKALNEASLQYMMLVLDVVKDISLDVDEIDIRAGTVAYRLRGNSVE